MSEPARMRHVEVGHGAGAGEARIDVDDRRAARLGLHHPLEADRVALGHVGALDDDAVGVLQILLEGGGAAAAERDPQTGDRGGVSNTGLVFDLHDAERGEELLDQVVLFVVQRGAAQVGDAQRALDAVALRVLVFPGGVARAASRARPPCPSPAPAGCVSHSVPCGPAVEDVLHAVRAGDELEGGRAFGAEAAARDRASRDRPRCR